MTTAEQTVQRTYRAHEVIAITGITYRQLDFWIRSDYLSGPHLTGLGHGTAREFTSDELDLIHAVHAVRGLLTAGFTVEAAFHIADRIVHDDRYDAVLADIYDLTITVRDTRPQPPAERTTP